MHSYYVKLIGADDLPLPNNAFAARPELEVRVRFPRSQFPADMKKGDELLYYAVGGYKKVFAIARLVEDPRREVPTEEPGIFKRWPHAAKVEIGTRLDRVDFGPDLSEVNPRLMDNIHKGVSHFPISVGDFERAARLLRKAKLAEDKAKLRR